MHIVNALSTFGTKGQDEVRKANAARLNRAPVAKSATTATQWIPAERPGKPTGLPTSEVIESPLKPAKPQALPVSKAQPSQATTEKAAPVAQPSEKRSVQVVETETAFQDLVNAKPADIPTRPTKVLELYGIEQIKTYLEISGVEIKEGASEREIAGLLIQTVNKK